MHGVYDMGTPSQRTRVAAYGLILNDRKILLCRISGELPEWQGQWTLPGGGLNFGEDPEAAMIREVGEETGLSVSAVSIAGIDSLHDDSRAQEFHGIRIIYRTRLLGGSLRSELSGTTDLAAWFDYDDLSTLPLVDVAEYGFKLAYKK